MIPGAENLHVVLVAPRNPLNIGAAARAISNFGFSSLRLVNAYDVAFREARSAVKAGHILEQAREFESLADAIGDCLRVYAATEGSLRDLHTPLQRIEYVTPSLRSQLTAGPAALVFGSEKFGLSREDLSHCHELLRIPTRPGHPSMNLGQAVAICLYELIRDDEAAKTKPRRRRRADSAAQERVSNLLTGLLDDSGWLNPSTADSSTLKVRELVRRMDLSAKDAEVWFGILRQIRWRLDHPSG